jgi:cell division protein FtsZ
MDEIFEITEYVQEEAGYGTDLIWGNCHDESLGEKLSVTVIATGFSNNKKETQARTTEQTNTNFQQPKTVVQPEKQVRVSLDDEEDVKNFTKAPLYSNYTDINSVNKETLHSSSGYIRENVEPYVKEEQKEEPISNVETAEQRRLRLRDLNLKLENPEIINELENQPAYLRKGLKLENVDHSSEQKFSRMSFSDQEEPTLKNNNSYLHDNVD